jgi:transcriptional regulator with XRE-family HTH domain
MALRPQNRIKHFRALKGLSTTRLAELAGMAQSHVSRLENGRSAITLDQLYHLARVLEIDPRELLAPDDQKVEVSLAPLRADFNGPQIFEPPYQLVPIPLAVSYEAIRVANEHYLFGEKRFPTTRDYDTPWVLHLSIDAETLLLQCVCFGDLFYPRGDRTSLPRLDLNSPYIVEAWRIRAEFIELTRRTWPTTFS